MLFTRELIRMFSIAGTLAAVSLSLLTTALLTAASGDMEEKLESAIHREVVVGDLKAAMVQYQAVIRDSTNRPEIARALYRYGRCLEKLQRRTEAYKVYARLVKDFSDQPEAGLTRARLAGWEYSISGPANLNFEQGVPGKLPDAWFVPAMPNDVDHWAQLRHSGCMNRDSCAVVLVPENAPVRAGNLMQSFSAAAYRGRTIRLSAWLRLEATAAEDRGQMWLSVDRANDKKGFFDDMKDNAVFSPEWTFREIRVRIDQDATFIKFGVMSIGRGRVWVDRVAFEVVPEGGQP
jgi:hypothetical protein